MCEDSTSFDFLSVRSSAYLHYTFRHEGSFVLALFFPSDGWMDVSIFPPSMTRRPKFKPVLGGYLIC